MGRDTQAMNCLIDYQNILMVFYFASERLIFGGGSAINGIAAKAIDAAVS
jgi:hypothetical protein